MAHLSQSAVPLLQDLLRTVQGRSCHDESTLMDADINTNLHKQGLEQKQKQIELAVEVEVEVEERDLRQGQGQGRNVGSRNVKKINRHNTENISLTVFSGHDVTLFAMLFALNADVITSNSPNSQKLYWPPFGTFKHYNYFESYLICYDYEYYEFISIPNIRIFFCYDSR